MLLHVRFCHARLGARGKQLGLRNNLLFIRIKPIPVAIWTGGRAAGYDRLASLADFVVLRSFDDLLCARRTIGEMAIRHIRHLYPMLY